MTKFNAFAKIKALFANENFNDAKLADGTLIQWEGDLAEGVAIMTIDTDGNTLPIADGTYTMEDGSEVYTMGGLVTKIEPASEDVNGENPAEAPETMAVSDTSMLEERLAACETKMADMEKKMQEMLSAVEMESQNVDSKFNEIKEIVETIADEPIVVAEAPKNSTFKKAKPSKTAAEKIADWKNSLK